MGWLPPLRIAVEQPGELAGWRPRHAEAPTEFVLRRFRPPRAGDACWRLLTLLRLPRLAAARHRGHETSLAGRRRPDCTSTVAGKRGGRLLVASRFFTIPMYIRE